MFKNFCRLILMMIIGFFIFQRTTYAEILTYEGIGEYTMSDFETAGIAKERAKLYAVRDAQSKAGVYIKSLSKTVEYELAEDEIIAISAGILQIIDVKIISVPSDEGVTFRAAVKVNIESDNINEWLKRDPKERERLVQQNNKLQKSLSIQEEQIINLKKLLATVKTPEEIEKIKSEFAKIDNEFLANQKLEEGQNFYNRGDYFSAIKSYDQAVELNPNNFYVYVNRGAAYQDLKDYSRALSDYDKALSLNLNYSLAYAVYNNRGIVYRALKQYEKAIEDFSKAIEINPNRTEIYINRGNIYDIDLENYDRALEDYNRAIELDPNFTSDYYKIIARAYVNRGAKYYNSKQYEKAMVDFNQAIKLNPNLPEAYYNRGICYEALRNYSKAQADFLKAKSLGLNF